VIDLLMMCETRDRDKRARRDSLTGPTRLCRKESKRS
jgi:hypothetical protein